MKRAWSLLLSVLLGAVAVGLGTGYFLHLANTDRQQLAKEADLAKAQAMKAQQERQAAVEEANRKVEQANAEVNKAQTAIKDLQKERMLIDKARVLTAPTPAAISDWLLAVSTHHGVSFKHPAGSKIIQDDKQIFSLSASSSQSNAQQTPDPWLTISEYNPDTLKLLSQRLSSSTTAVYMVDGTLLNGEIGRYEAKDSTQTMAGVFEMIKNGTTTSLLWIQSPPISNPGRKAKTVILEDVLSTFDFEQKP